MVKQNYPHTFVLIIIIIMYEYISLFTHYSFTQYSRKLNDKINIPNNFFSTKFKLFSSKFFSANQSAITVWCGSGPGRGLASSLIQKLMIVGVNAWCRFKERKAKGPNYSIWHFIS